MGCVICCLLLLFLYISYPLFTSTRNPATECEVEFAMFVIYSPCVWRALPQLSSSPVHCPGSYCCSVLDAYHVHGHCTCSFCRTALLLEICYYSYIVVSRSKIHLIFWRGRSNFSVFQAVEHATTHLSKPLQLTNPPQALPDVTSSTKTELKVWVPKATEAYERAKPDCSNTSLRLFLCLEYVCPGSWLKCYTWMDKTKLEKENFIHFVDLFCSRTIICYSANNMLPLLLSET